MAEAADFSMPDAFAKDYLDRIIKKTELEAPRSLYSSPGYHNNISQ